MLHLAAELTLDELSSSDLDSQERVITYDDFFRVPNYFSFFFSFLTLFNIKGDVSLGPAFKVYDEPCVKVAVS